MNRNLKTSKHRNRRNGATTVEFAFVVPIIMLMFVGCLEMSNLNFIRNMANDAAFQVARRSIVPGADSVSAINDSKALLAQAGINQVAITATEGLDNVAVVVSVPIDENSWGLGRFISGKTIVQSCALSKQIHSSVEE